MRLLIVEDEEDMREALCYGLRKRGYAVDAAGDGADAVNASDVVIMAAAARPAAVLCFNIIIASCD